MGETTWTGTEEALLIALRNEGLSIAKIAERMNRSRGSIIGKVNRLGLTKHKPRFHKITPAPPTPPPLPYSPPPPDGISLLDLLPNRCRFPINSPPRGGTYFFCGKLADDVYCPFHSALAGVPYGKDRQYRRG